jgi:hypothetical protein
LTSTLVSFGASFVHAFASPLWSALAAVLLALTVLGEDGLCPACGLINRDQHLSDRQISQHRPKGQSTEQSTHQATPYLSMPKTLTDCVFCSVDHFTVDRVRFIHSKRIVYGCV